MTIHTLHDVVKPTIFVHAGFASKIEIDESWKAENERKGHMIAKLCNIIDIARYRKKRSIDGGTYSEGGRQAISSSRP